jgi:hypothetical protein
MDSDGRPEAHEEITMPRREERGTLADRHTYKGVEYALQRAGPAEWKWAIHPKVGSGISAKRGKVIGSREEADAACKAAIEQAFRKRALR